MRHRVRGRKLGRNTAHRTSLMRNLLTALFAHGRIVTTLPKAKEYRPYAEKLITIAKVKSLHNIRKAAAVVQDKAVLQKLFDEIGPRFVDRNGGYTRILKLAKPRLGDNAKQAIFELVDYAVPSEGKDRKKGKKKKKEKKKKSE